MDWKKPVITAALTGMMIFTAAGCAGVTASSSTAAEKPVATETTTDIIGGNRAPDNAFSQNGTMPVPPGGQPGGMPAMPEIDWAAAAEKLGITEEALKEAAGGLTEGMPDFTSIAEKLGVTEQELMEALGFQGGNMPPRGQPPDNGIQPPQGGQSGARPGTEY